MLIMTVCHSEYLFITYLFIVIILFIFKCSIHVLNLNWGGKYTVDIFGNTLF